MGAAEVDEREAAEVIARIGSCIDDLLTGYTDVRRSSAAGAFVRGRALLAENYRHTLGQMRGLAFHHGGRARGTLGDL